MKIRKAYILAGGKGTRLRPLTYKTPKPLIQIGEKPLLLHTIDRLKAAGIDEFVISVQYLKEQIMDYFKNGSDFGVKISYFEEDEPLGTAGALPALKKRFGEPFLMLNGDVLSQIDITDLERIHEQNNSSATLALVAVDNPSACGVVKLEGDKIVEFLEKPKNPPTNLVNGGFYLLEPDIIDLIPEGFSMIEKDVFPKLASEGKLYGHHYPGPWIDIGTPEKLEKAIKEWE